MKDLEKSGYTNDKHIDHEYLHCIKKKVVADKQRKTSFFGAFFNKIGLKGINNDPDNKINEDDAEDDDDPFNKTAKKIVDDESIDPEIEITQIKVYKEQSTRKHRF